MFEDGKLKKERKKKLIFLGDYFFESLVSKSYTDYRVYFVFFT